MIYRSRTEIISVILQATDSGASVTKVMYNSYLSYALTKKYIKFLKENQMVTYEEKTQLYKTTEKGKRFMRMYGEINKLFNSKLNKTSEFSNSS
jgi:predicted transcriptional regulator